MNLLISLYLFTVLVTPTNNDVEAKAEYEKFTNSVFYKHTSGDYFSIYPSTNSLLYHYKGLTTSLKKENITLVESLNGIEWKGKISIKANAVRSTLNNSANWTEWREMPAVSINIIKKRGTWRILKADINSGYGNSVPDKSFVDQALLKPMDD